jgi:hypothetical protein
MCRRPSITSPLRTDTKDIRRVGNAVPEYGFTRAPDEVLAVRNQPADRVIQALQQAGLPAVRYPGTIGPHMQGALIKILLSSGVIAAPEDDTTNPDHVLVFRTMSDLPPALRPPFIPESPSRP